MEIARAGAALGAEVTDLDPADPFPADVVEALRKALLDHHVLVMHPGALTPNAHLALGRAFGPVEVHAFFPSLGAGLEEISVLDSTVPGSVASMWHTDESFLERPPMATLLYSEVIPAVGGDTAWASSAAAYDALSPAMKRYLDGLTAVHDLSRTVELAFQFGHATADRYAASVAADRRFAHPVVCTHPETGAKGLYVNPTYTRSIVGVAPDESAAILGYLFAHATKEQFVFRHRWREGDLVMWDNRGTMHMAMNDFAGHRRMLRVSVLGTDVPS